MSYNNNITPGTAPLLWSNLNDAFSKVNENFTIIQATVLGGGASAVDFSNLSSDVVATATNLYSLGTGSKAWKALHIADASLVPGSENNGLWLGTAQITSSNGTITLPLSTTLAGNLIIDPDKTFFKSIEIDNGNKVVAARFNDNLHLNSGTAIQLIADSSGESITFNNTGVTSTIASTGISVSSSTGAVTITNTGVTRVTAGEGISVTGTTGNITITNSGIRGIQVVTGLSVTIDPTTKIATLNNNSPASSLFTFRNISVPGSSLISAASNTDTLTMFAGYGVNIVTNPGTKSLTLSVNPKIDITGSIFADDSTLLVDGVGGKIVGPVFANVTVNVTGNVTGNITGTAPAGNLTGTILASNVVTSSLTTVGTLGSLTVTNTGKAANFISGLTNFAAAGTTTTLTVNSNQEQTITGTLAHTIKLPVATTLTVGHSFTINNNTTSTNSVTIQYSDGSTWITVTPGGAKEVVLLDNTTAVGVWDIHGYLPSNGGWGTTYFNSGSSTFDALAGPTTLSFGAAATALTIGANGSGSTTVRNISVLKSVKKIISPIAGATGVVAHDYNLSDTWLHTNVQANFNVDIQNMALASGASTIVKLVVVQGATPRIPNAILIDGSNSGVTLYWENNATPTGNANKRDVFTFEIINSSSTFIVLGTFKSFG